MEGKRLHGLCCTVPSSNESHHHGRSTAGISHWNVTASVTWRRYMCCSCEGMTFSWLLKAERQYKLLRIQVSMVVVERIELCVNLFFNVIVVDASCDPSLTVSSEGPRCGMWDGRMNKYILKTKMCSIFRVSICYPEEACIVRSVRTTCNILPGTTTQRYRE